MPVSPCAKLFGAEPHQRYERGRDELMGYWGADRCVSACDLPVLILGEKIKKVVFFVIYCENSGIFLLVKLQINQTSGKYHSNTGKSQTLCEARGRAKTRCSTKA